MPIEHANGDALFRALIATAVDGIIVIDANGRVQVYIKRARICSVTPPVK
jgi:hypothetical protein